ncbi:M28 family peptidase, partial [bacterium]|nr:M28 family peptidase [bacterium]
SLAALQAAPQGPVTLYRVHLNADGAAHRTAIQHQWPVYDLSGQDLLVGADVSAEVGAKGAVAQVYQGDLAALRWVTVRRGADPSGIALRALYAAGDRYLLRSADVPAGLADKPESYWVKPFRTQGTKLAGDSTIINPNLAYNPAIAALVAQVDSAQIRTWLLALQGFGTRHVSAGNHATVTAWVKTQFTGMGIASVVTDTCYGTTGHNVIATVPGLYDTVTLYIAGGHYDSYSTGSAPGANDNASGTVAAMELARVLAQPGNRPNATVKFMAFDAEELGLYGSEFVAGRMAAAGATIGCMLNFDMIGCEGNDSIFNSQHYAGSTAYAQLLIRMARLYGRHADTNVAGQYGTSYLGQSDSYPFSQEGFPVAWVLEEYDGSGIYHTARDSVSHMNLRYMTGNVKGAMGFFATLAFHPAKVAGVTVTENGDGQTLALSWRRDAAANIAGYKVYWSRSSGSYADYHVISGAADTTDSITGLMADSLYYVAVVAVNNEDQESVFLDEFRARPFSGTLATAFFDDFESGLSLWTRSGTPNWDTTSASYHSAGHSVTDSRTGNYGNNVNSYIQVLNGIDLTGYNHASLSWWERYATESGWDFCRPEYSINGGAWTALVAAYSGSSTSWQQRTFDLTGICPTTTNYRFRFRFTTDGNTVDDGWYVDDVLLTGYVPTGVSGAPAAPAAAGRLRLQCRPSPATTRVELSFSLPAAGEARLDVYVVAGRRVAALGGGMRPAGEHRLKWDCRDAAGRRVANGTYLVRITAGGATAVAKVALVR